MNAPPLPRGTSCDQRLDRPERGSVSLNAERKNINERFESYPEKPKNNHEESSTAIASSRREEPAVRHEELSVGQNNTDLRFCK